MEAAGGLQSTGVSELDRMEEADGLQSTGVSELDRTEQLTLNS